MEVVGDVIGVGASNKLTSATITLGLSAGGGAVDFEKLVVTFSNKTLVQTLDKNDTFYAEDANADAGKWLIAKKMNSDGGNLLESREQFTISVGFPGVIDPNGEFTIEVKPVVGSSLVIVRTAPEQIDAINRLF